MTFIGFIASFTVLFTKTGPNTVRTADAGRMFGWGCGLEVPGNGVKVNMSKGECNTWQVLNICHDPIFDDTNYIRHIDLLFLSNAKSWHILKRI